SSKPRFSPTGRAPETLFPNSPAAWRTSRPTLPAARTVAWSRSAGSRYPSCRHGCDRVVMNSTDRVDVLVVGGGIGGLSAAFALARQGVQVKVLEQAPRFEEVGAGIQLAPNCTRILDEYGLLDEAKSLGVLPEAMALRDAVDGAELTRL